MNKQQPQTKELKLNIPQNLEPCFANFVQINHKNDEFNLMFAHATPMGTGTIKASVTMTPQHMKIFLDVVSENIKKFESVFGEIKVNGITKETENVTYIQ